MALPIRLAAVSLIMPGLFGTIALPAYAALPDSEAEVDATTPESVAAAVQSFRVDSAVTELPVERSEISATTEEELAEIRAAEAAAAAAAASYAGVANPGAASANLGTIVSIAMQYQGVPYVFGGSTPAGFDCSGFTMYVYAQVGISLPHGSASQASGGTRIAASAAQPGDLVVLDGGGHIGIYLGNGQMIDAPYPGKTVQARAIYTSNHYFVRY
ncbi:C40 family peptidase [uncultured Schumannella sp.]|uniref:C40 family peptidase n=1 Tax=uncultured Schumannella sp. TaxID=1195956 RepID=UPI0025CCA5A1|nr:C40 family peptidase [uncultured Schumannella sp.]